VAAVVAAGGLLAATHRRELDAALGALDRADLKRLVLPGVLEAVSVVALAALERWLLRAAGSRLGLGAVTAVAAGANAMTGVLPGGGVLSLGWTVRQLRRRGVAFATAAAALAAAGAVSVLVLVLLLTLGALVADPAGPAPALRQGVLFGVAACGGLGLLLGSLALWPRLRGAGLRAWRRLGAGRPGIARFQAAVEDIGQELRRLGPVRRVFPDQPGSSGAVGCMAEDRPRTGPYLGDATTQQTVVPGEPGPGRSAGQAPSPSPRGWGRPLLLSALNWGADAGCLAACLWALGLPVPWRGFLLMYTLTQLFGSLRLTPGSLGITEASLTALLVLYGLPTGQAIAATLLYRGFSFWLLQPIGWSCWLVVTLHTPRPQAE
jgi:uncharacterized membrane protein YbhN (UPF0104 family)